MAFVTSTVIVGTEWTLVVSGVAMLQFNSEMVMAITSGSNPADGMGFVMEKNEKYVNNSATAYVWAKLVPSKIDVPSVRVLKDVV